MNWVRELLDLYEKNKALVGKTEVGRFGEDVILLPPFHTTVKAQITVRIDPNGVFLRADRVPKDDALTVIPVTEESGVRTSGIASHPLCDNLAYIDGGYNDFAPEKDKNASEKHRLYLEGIKAWAESDFSHEKVRAVYKYVSREHTIKDLLASGVLNANEKGEIPDIKQNSFLRFSVEGEWTPDSDMAPPECWLDETLREAYIEYVRSRSGDAALSYLTGEVVPISYLQPKKIRNEGDGAKLISSNDSDGYTFRGRFANKEEAFAIGYEESQEIHNALKWIIRRQGKRFDELTVVVWESELCPIPDYSESSDEICDEALDFLDDDDSEGEEKRCPDATYAVEFLSAIDGYRRKAQYSSNVVIMALNAATPGRLSVAEASSLPTTVYLDNIERWHRECGFYHISHAKDKHEFYGMVSVKDAANMLYGDDKLLPTVCNRLRACIVFGKPLPNDMVRLAVQRASSPLSYESRTDWERVLSLACSMVKKKHIEKGNKEEFSVALNNESRNRSYLYGRLLAVADRIEYRTYEANENRQTNAKRYMNAFSQKPYRTWKVIAERLDPYLQKLPIGEKLKYIKLTDEIYELFDENDFADDSPLEGLYLLGFHNQSYALKNKTEIKTEEEKDND